MPNEIKLKAVFDSYDMANSAVLNLRRSGLDIHSYNISTKNSAEYEDAGATASTGYRFSNINMGTLTALGMVRTADSLMPPMYFNDQSQGQVRLELLLDSNQADRAADLLRLAKAHETSRITKL